MWPKVMTIIDYWKKLLRSKEPGSGKPVANVSYDHLCAALNDPLIHLKKQKFCEVAEKLTNFLVVFQTDKPMTPFFGRNITLEVLLRWFR